MLKRQCREETQEWEDKIGKCCKSPGEGWRPVKEEAVETVGELPGSSSAMKMEMNLEGFLMDWIWRKKDEVKASAGPPSIGLFPCHCA